MDRDLPHMEGGTETRGVIGKWVSHGAERIKAPPGGTAQGVVVSSEGTSQGPTHQLRVGVQQPRIGQAQCRHHNTTTTTTLHTNHWQHTQLSHTIQVHTIYIHYLYSNSIKYNSTASIYHYCSRHEGLSRVTITKCIPTLHCSPLHKIMKILIPSAGKELWVHWRRSVVLVVVSWSK